MIVGLVADDVDTLVVSWIEVGISQVIGIRNAWEGVLDGCGNGIERHIALYDVFHLVFLAAFWLVEPPSEGTAIELGDIVSTKGKLADGILTLHHLDADERRTVVVEVGEGVLCVEGSDLVLSQRADAHEGTIVHTRDGQCRGLARVVEHIDIVPVVLPTAWGVGSLRGYHIACGIGYGDGSRAVGTLSDRDFYVRGVRYHHLQGLTAVLAVELSTDGGYCAGVVGSHTADGSVIGNGHTKVDCCSLDLLLSRQQGSVLIVDDGAKVLETVCPAHYRKHQQEAQCAQSFHLFGHNAFLLIVRIKIK